MTVITKPSLIFKKAALLSSTNYDEEVIEIQPCSEASRRRALLPLLCMTLMALAITVAGIMCGTMLYRQMLRPRSSLHRYQGYCTIPISSRHNMDPALIEPNYRVMPLRWSPEPDVQVVSLLDESTSDDLMNLLREELDIADSVEKISVFENGKKVNFIHDFDSNMTGIVDSERCYTMELDPTLVLSPELFVLSIARGEQFDVSRVRHQLRADLNTTSTTSLPHLDDCAGKPTYRLQREDTPAIRKRSLDAPPHDYIQFSGRHVQEIEITNLAQLLEEEQRVKNKPAHA